MNIPIARNITLPSFKRPLFLAQKAQTKAPPLNERADQLEYEPLCDSWETETYYSFALDLPGLKKNEVAVEVKGRRIIVSGIRKVEAIQSGSSRGLRERQHGPFERILELPTWVDPKKVKAYYDEGVLRIDVSKQASENVRTEIQSKFIPVPGTWSEEQFDIEDCDCCTS